jgi:hypothetical protein
MRRAVFWLPPKYQGAHRRQSLVRISPLHREESPATPSPLSGVVWAIQKIGQAATVLTHLFDRAGRCAKKHQKIPSGDLIA